MNIGGKSYLTVKEVSKILGVSIPTVRVCTEKGLIEAKRHPVSRYRLYLENEVREFLKNMEGKI